MIVCFNPLADCVELAYGDDDQSPVAVGFDILSKVAGPDQA
jgi:hypothetical protein